jgi:uncharacterized membrane protein
MMASYDTLLFYTGTYPSVESADADYEAVKDLHYDLGLIDTFDAAVVGKKDDGKVKIYKKHEQPTRHGGWVGVGWGLATGLTIALVPAAAIGGGLLADATATGAGIGAIAGHVSSGVSRGDLKDHGDLLDGGQAALVVAAATNLEGCPGRGDLVGLRAEQPAYGASSETWRSCSAGGWFFPLHHPQGARRSPPCGRSTSKRDSPMNRRPWRVSVTDTMRPAHETSSQ